MADDRLSLEHIIRNIAEGKFTPSDEPKVSLSHAIRSVHESVGTIGTDKFKGSQFMGVRTVTPHISPDHHSQAAETVSNARKIAKQKTSLTLHGKVAEEAPSDMSGVTAGTQTFESGKKKSVKEVSEIGADSTPVSTWPTSESGKKKIKEEAEGTKDRREIEFRPRMKNSPDRKDIKYVGRMDDADPKSKKSILGRTGAVTTRDIPEDVTQVVFNPPINPPPVESESGKAKTKTRAIKIKKIVKEAMTEATVGGVVGKGVRGLSAVDAASNLAQGKVGQAALSGLGMTTGPIGAAAATSSLLGMAATETDTGKKVGSYIRNNVLGAERADRWANTMRGVRDTLGLGPDKSSDSSVVGAAQAASKPAPQATPQPSSGQSKPVQPVTKTASAPAPSKPAQQSAGGYTVQKGDTLSGIAKKSGVSVAQLAKDNNIKDVNKIFSGSNLKINK